MTSLLPMVRRSLGRGVFATFASLVVLAVPCLIGRERFDTEWLAALTIGAAVMGYDYLDFAREARRRKADRDVRGRARPVAVLLAVGAAALGTGVAARLAIQPDVDRARWTRDGVTHELETRLWPWDDHAEHHRRALEVLLEREL